MSLEGQRLGEFEILGLLGQGATGSVYKAKQSSLHRFVALKTLNLALANDAAYIRRFQREASSAAALNHANLVQVYSSGESQGVHWFSMEYVDGESVKSRLQRNGQLDPQEAIAIGVHVATALDYGWRKAGLIHRDVKPDNIFLSADGEVKLGDLGLAKSAGQLEELTMTGQSMGTPNYISPEQVQALKSVDLRTDIYSLGCTLFHLLSGRPPFQGNGAVTIMMKHVTDPVPSLRQGWRQCPPVLANVIGKMMQKKPERRQQTHEEVIADLRHAYEVVSNPSRKADFLARTRITVESLVTHPSRPLLSIAGAIACATLATAAFLLAGQGKGSQNVVVPSQAALPPVAEGARSQAHSKPVFTMAATPSPVPRNSSSTFPPGVWTRIDVRDAAFRPFTVKGDGAVTLTHGMLLPGVTAKDIAVRARVQRHAGAQHSGLQVRMNGPNNRNLDLRDAETSLASSPPGPYYPPIPHDTRLGQDRPVLLQLAAIGDTTFGAIDDILLPNHRTPTVMFPGGVLIWSQDGDFRDIEVMVLDGVPKANWPDFVQAALQRRP